MSTYVQSLTDSTRVHNVTVEIPLSCVFSSPLVCCVTVARILHPRLHALSTEFGELPRSVGRGHPSRPHKSLAGKAQKDAVVRRQRTGCMRILVRICFIWPWFVILMIPCVQTIDTHSEQTGNTFVVKVWLI